MTGPIRYPSLSPGLCLPPNRCTHPRRRWIDAEGDDSGITYEYHCPDCGLVFSEYTGPREQ